MSSRAAGSRYRLGAMRSQSGHRDLRSHCQAAEGIDINNGGRQGGMETTWCWKIFLEHILEDLVKDWKLMGMGFESDGRGPGSRAIWADYPFMLIYLPLRGMNLSFCSAGSSQLSQRNARLGGSVFSGCSELWKGPFTEPGAKRDPLAD